MKLKFLLLTAILFLNTDFANAQFLKKLGDKAKEATERVLERKTEEKVEKTTEDAVDDVLEAPKKVTKKKKNKKKSNNNSQLEANVEDSQFPGNIFSGESHYENQYLFPVTATIELEDSSADVQKMTMKQGYGKQSLITEMESGNTPIIVDMKNQSAVMLDIKAGTAQVMSLEWMEKMMSGSNTTEDTSSSQPKVIKTGETKKINGYMCHEYNIFHEEGKINAWYAPDVKFDYQDYLRGMSKMFSKKAEENPSQLLNTQYGYVMEMTAFTKENKKQSSMKVIKLEEKVRMINMDLFKIQKI